MLPGEPLERIPYLRDFQPLSTPNHVRGSDITYIPL